MTPPEPSPLKEGDAVTAAAAAAAAAEPTEPKAATATATATKKKERVIAVPPCPPSVATAYLILRGAVMAVTGAAAVHRASNDDVDVNDDDTATTTTTTKVPPAAAAAAAATVSVLQATYLKEKNLSGKFSVNLGKKLGDVCELQLPETAGGQEELLTAIEAAANRVVQEHRAVRTLSASRRDFAAQYGPACLLPADERGGGSSSKKTKGEDTSTTTSTTSTSSDDELVTAACIEDWVVAVPPGVPLASTGGSMERIVLDRSQCSVSASAKKARSKAEVTLKFLVIEGDATDATATTSATTHVALAGNEASEAANKSFDVSALQQARIRCPEGLALRDSFLAAAATTTTALEEVECNKVAAADAVVVVTEAAEEEDDEMVVNVEEVKGKIDYTKLVDKFGSTLIDDALLEQLKAETVGKGRVPTLHRFLRRGMFFSHRDLHNLLQAVSTHNTPLYLYTGRGPSSESMHLGHLIPFLFTKWLQDAFDAPLVVQMTDDEKFIFKGVYDEQTGDDLDRFAALTIENARDIIACGFDYNKTFLFSDLDYVGRMYPNIVRIWKAVTTNAVTHIFGFDGSANIGKVAFPAIQAAPSFASSFPTVLQANRESEHLCLIPCAIDQDPYFRMTRDIAHKLVLGKKHKLAGKPALIHSKFFPPLQGATGKMSSSDENSAIFLTDSAEDIKRKITHHSFSGGRETKAKQQEMGADLEIDVSYQWLRFFLEDDDELAQIGESYGSGKGDYWSTGSVKARLIEVLQKLVSEHQERRAKITDEEVRKWMKERSIV